MKLMGERGGATTTSQDGGPNLVQSSSDVQLAVDHAYAAGDGGRLHNTGALWVNVDATAWRTVTSWFAGPSMAAGPAPVPRCVSLAWRCSTRHWRRSCPC
jgi:hypothetical protein